LTILAASEGTSSGVQSGKITYTDFRTGKARLREAPGRVGTVNRIIRAIYRRLGIIHVGRRRVRDLVDFLENRKIEQVIDVGANNGQFGEFLRANGYRGKIISFEPIEAEFQTLSRKAAADGNWEAHHCGLGAVTGQATIHVAELTVFSSILPSTDAAAQHDSRTAIDHTETIPIRTLDEVAAGLTGNLFLKIDTQGYEKQVIEGGRQTLPRLSGILMELPIFHVYAGEWQFHEGLKFMADAGFVPAQIQAVNYHGKDKVSAVDFDCLFRPIGPSD
jgi:FkbM family methyltransferase